MENWKITEKRSNFGTPILKGEANNIKPPQITLRKFDIDYLK